jgi:hypothetical protein
LAAAGLRVLDLERILTEPPPRRDDLWAEVIEHGETVWLQGDGAAGKSILALSLGVAALTGAGSFLRRDVGPLERMIYVDGENRDATIARRLHLLGVPVDLAREERLRYLAASGTDLGSSAGIAALDHLLGGGAARTLLVLDSLVALHTADEDRAGEVRRFVAGLREVTRREGQVVTTLGIAHENRGASLRGSLDWRNAVDRTLVLRRDVKSPAWREVTPGKVRDGPDDGGPVARFRFLAEGERLSLVTEEASAGERGAMGGRPDAERAEAQRDEIIARIAGWLEEVPDLTRREASRRLGLHEDNRRVRDLWPAAERLAAERREGRWH